MSASNRIIACCDKMNRVKMSEMVNKSVPGAKIQVSVAKGDSIKIKSSNLMRVL